MIHEQAILVEQDGVVIKAFKYWFDENKRSARIEVDFMEFSFKTKGDKVASLLCDEAIIKHWAPYDIQNHTLIHSSGHNHAVKTSKKVKTEKQISFL